MIRVWKWCGYKQRNGKLIIDYALGIGKTEKVAKIRAERKHHMYLREFIA